VACAICGVAIPRKALHDGHGMMEWCQTTVVNHGLLSETYWHGALSGMCSPGGTLS
jgi:hypothetical protein